MLHSTRQLQAFSNWSNAMYNTPVVLLVNLISGQTTVCHFRLFNFHPIVHGIRDAPPPPVNLM